jgi:hypothetical protein
VAITLNKGSIQNGKKAQHERLVVYQSGIDTFSGFSGISDHIFVLPVFYIHKRHHQFFCGI